MKIEYREPRISFIELGDETIKKIISYTGGNYDCKGDFVCAEDIDVIIEDGKLPERIRELESCIRTKAKYELGRTR